MKRAFFVLMLVGVLGWLLPAGAQAAIVKSYNELSPSLAQELQESEVRLVADDRALQALDSDRRHRRIGAQDYAWQSRDLTAYIAAEAQFQDEILTRGSSEGVVLPDGVDKVLQTVGKYTVYVGASALRVAAQWLASAH